MIWVSGIILVVLATWLLVAFPGARWVMLGLMGVAAVVVAWIVHHNERQAEIRRAQELAERDAQRKIEARLKSLIKPSELSITNLEFQEAQYPRGSFVFSADIKNNSPSHHLDTVTIAVTFHDCPGDTIDKDCLVIQQSLLQFKANVPAGQARNVSGRGEFERLPRYRTLKWDYNIAEVRAQ